MRKVLLLLIISFISILSFGQATPSVKYNIPNATSDFGITIPRGATVVDLNTNREYLCITGALGTDDLTSASAKFLLTNNITAGTDVGQLNYWDGSKWTPESVSILQWSPTYRRLFIHDVYPPILQDGSSNTGTDKEINNTYVAIKFIASGNHTVQSTITRLKRIGTVSNVAETIRSFLYTDVAGVPGTAINGINVPEAYGEIGTSYQDYESQAGQAVLVSGTAYWIVIVRTAAPTGGGTINLDGVNSGTAMYAHSANGTSWTTVNNFTGYFKLEAINYPAIDIEKKNYYSLLSVSHSEYGGQFRSYSDAGILTNSTTAQGIVAQSVYGSGVYGSSTHSAGVEARSINSYGLYAISTNGYATYSEGKAGFSSHLHIAQISAPSPVTDNLYNVGGVLTWNGITFLSGLGDANYLPKYTGPNTFGNSNIHITSIGIESVDPNLILSDYVTVGRMTSGADAVFGHNIYADASSRVLKQKNTGYYAAWIRMVYNEGIHFGTSTVAGTTGDVVCDPTGTTNEKWHFYNNGNIMFPYVGSSTDVDSVYGKDKSTGKIKAIHKSALGFASDDSIPFFYNPARNSVYLKYLTARITLGGNATTHDINRKLHIIGSMDVTDTLWFYSGAYIMDQGEGLYTNYGWNMLTLTVRAGGVASLPNISYTTIPASDHTTSGDLISLTAAANSAIGDVIYIASSGKATFCKADAIANCPYALAVCAIASVSADASCNWLTKGSVRDDSWSWTVGGLIYVSTTGTSGNTLTQTAPSGANNVIIPVGVALSADVMYFFGNLNTVEHN